MPGPSWLKNQIEPVAIRDVLYYLAHACALATPVNRPYDIGCGRAQSFGSMLEDYACEDGLTTRKVFALHIPDQHFSGILFSILITISRGIVMPREPTTSVGSV